MSYRSVTTCCNTVSVLCGCSCLLHGNTDWPPSCLCTTFALHTTFYMLSAGSWVRSGAHLESHVGEALKLWSASWGEHWSTSRNGEGSHSTIITTSTKNNSSSSNNNNNNHNNNNHNNNNHNSNHNNNNSSNNNNNNNHNNNHKNRTNKNNHNDYSSHNNHTNYSNHNHHTDYSNHKHHKTITTITSITKRLQRSQPGWGQGQE